MENRKSKREAIIFSALEIFERDGFHKAKVEDIAKGANVGKGTIYEYFDSKRDLFYQMVKSMMDKYFDLVQNVVEENIDPISKLHNLVKLQLELTSKHANLGHIIQVEAIKSGIRKDLKLVFIEFRRKQINIVEKILEEGIEAKLFKKVNTYMAALFFLGGSVQFAFDQNVVEKCGGDKTELDMEEFVNTFLKGVM